MNSHPEPNGARSTFPVAPTTPPSPSWDEILKHLEIGPATNADPAWQTALERVDLQDPSRVLEGQRFQGQGQ